MNLWTTLTCQNSASVSVVFMEVCSPRGVCGAVWTWREEELISSKVSVTKNPSATLLGWAPCLVLLRLNRPRWRSLFKSPLNGSMRKLLLGRLQEIHTFGI